MTNEENKNQTINENNIIDLIIQLMEKVEEFIDMNGEEKKTHVMNSVKATIGIDAYKRYEYFIDSFIDFIISISKGKKINLNKITKKYCCF